MKKILVPVDFSDVSKSAAHFAVQLAKASGASVALLNSARIDYFTDYQYPTFSNAKSLMDEVLVAMQERMETMVNELREEGVEVDGKVSQLGLMAAIKEETDTQLIDLCVMGTTGSTGLEEVFIGSNTERIVRNIKCPVISIPQAVVLDTIKNVLVPIDLREIKPSFLKELAALQKLLGCYLKFLWVKTPHNIENEEAVSEELQELMALHGITNYSFYVVNNVFPSDGIFIESEEGGVDMIAMATHARRGIAHWLYGSLTEDTINHVHVPVWTFKIDKVEPVIQLNAVSNAKGIPEYRKIEPLTV